MLANDQLLKMLPLNHKIISTSPFVMSNSYIHNEELNLDGESMSDWYTGSANTLLKTIIKGLFGNEVSLESITIRPANEFISKEALFEFMVEGKKITVKYNNKLENSRKIYFNGKLMALSVDDISHTPYIVINKKDLIEINEKNIID